MIINNQTNIKVHFAGGENLMRSNMILKGARANYSLFTIFPFLCEQFGIKHGYQTKNTTYEQVSGFNYNNSRHCIQDSGLFSLMFGSYRGDKSEDFIERWYGKLIETTSSGGFKGTVVEVDCQKVLGVKKAWELRERMKNDLPDNRQINVFHKEDGPAGLDRLIEFSNYIAISVPELRAIKQKEYVAKIAHYIKNKKPLIDIHLLGCTENKLLRDLNFCTSADSTSWTSFNKFGQFKFNDGVKTESKKKRKLNKSALIDKYYPTAIELMKASGMKTNDPSVFYFSCDLLQLDYLLKQYAIYAGPQN